jgi:hypothetical protein
MIEERLTKLETDFQHFKYKVILIPATISFAISMIVWQFLI